MSSWITSEWATELRVLWNQFDPIGGISSTNLETDDEYDSYHRIILKHLNEGSDNYKLLHAIKHVVTVNMGMSWNDHLEKSTRSFIENVLNWFETKKPELNK